MKLENIIKGMDTISIKGNTAMDISSVTHDSRDVKDGSLFVAVKGVAGDGHEFIADALKRGAAAVMCEDEGNAVSGEGDAALVVVRDARDALAFASHRFYAAPSESFTLIGVTGTNGKTTTSYVIKHIIERWGKRAGLIGTIRHVTGNREIDAAHTTPGPVEYHGLLREMKGSKCEYVISEVSSHALSQKRVDYSRFSTAVFTNLSRDHLDYHKNMADYFEAKKRLFTELLDISGTAVVNADDEYSNDITKAVKCDVITYGIHAEADIRAVDIRQDVSGAQFRLIRDGGEFLIRTRLIGIPNIYNILAGAATAASLNVPEDIIKDAVTDMAPVEGRFETIMTERGVLFIVDYAHTPDALGKLLDTVNDLPHGKVITVFGCGGDRDKGKRPLMGKIAGEKSDFVVITSDNPRYEDPEAIMEDIRGGIGDTNFMTVPDREEAILEAVRRAEEGDIVVIAGKGHESYQEIKGVRLPMDDKGLALKALNTAGKI